MRFHLLHGTAPRRAPLAYVAAAAVGFLVARVRLPTPHIDHVPPRCDNGSRVPRIVHATGYADAPTYATTRSVSDGFELRYHNDSSARAFLAARCGDVYADAFDCLAVGAFRADLFRMCALYTVGGVYIDSDLLATRPLDAIFDMCQTTIAWDTPAWGVFSKKQMALVAAVPGDPLFLCHMRAILRHVRDRYLPWVRVAISGPIVFDACYREHGAAVGLIDLGAPRNVFAKVPTSDDYPDVVAIQLRARPTARHLTLAPRVYAPECAL